MHPDPEFDIAVIGYGPTGMVAASVLGRLGHRVVVVERWPDLYGLPRFTHIDGETARIVQASADGDRALQDSLPTSNTFVTAAGDVLVHMPRAEGVSGYAEHLTIHQPDIEAAIDERIRSLGTVQVRQGRALTGLTQDDDGVTLTLARWDADAVAVDETHTEVVRARWVVGADGARSAVRSLLGVERDDFGFNERWANVDAEWKHEVPERFVDVVQTCDPARGHMTMRIGQRRQRFEFALNDGEDPAEMATLDTAWALLGDTYDVGPDDVAILRKLVYTFESRVAQQWRVGRVLLAGDAAHTMPPYLGQGACSGMRDALNLAWKLDLVLRERASERLLDTYELERRPHATALVHGSIALGRIANTRDPQEAAARDAAFLAGKVPPPPPMPLLTGGVLHTGADGAVVPPVGGLTPQGTIRRAGRTGRLDDVVGFGFLLVTRADPAEHLTDSPATVPGRRRVFRPAPRHRGRGRRRCPRGLPRPDSVPTPTSPGRTSSCSAPRAGQELGALVDELARSLSWQPQTAAASR